MAWLFLQLKKWLFFPLLFFFLSPPPSFFSGPGDAKLLCAGSGQWKSRSLGTGSSFLVYQRVACLILDPDGHSLPDSHLLVKEHPLAKIMQITTAVPIFLRCLKCSDRQDGCAWVAAQPENKNLGRKKGSVLAAETPCLAVGSWLALTPRPRFSEGGLKAASRRSANPVSLPSLRQPHSFHRTLSNEHFRFIKGSFGNIFSSVKKNQTSNKVGAHVDPTVQAPKEGWEQLSPVGENIVV